MAKRRPLTDEAIGGDSHRITPEQKAELLQELNLPVVVKPEKPAEYGSEAEEARPTKSAKAEAKAPRSDTPKKINIDIGLARHNRLQDVAAQVRANNTDPVPPAQRVYPQHLIQVAVDLLLDELEIDWSEIRNTEDLREQIKGLTLQQLKG